MSLHDRNYVSFLAGDDKNAVSNHIFVCRELAISLLVSKTFYVAPSCASSSENLRGGKVLQTENMKSFFTILPFMPFPIAAFLSLGFIFAF